MPKKRFGPEQILAKLREAEVELTNGQKISPISDSVPAAAKAVAANPCSAVPCRPWAVSSAG